MTDKTLAELKRAGFFSFACGIENGSPTALARMNKSSTVDDNIRALDLFKKYDYYVQMGYILFDKDTTFQELLENYEFLNKYKFAITKGIFSEMFSTEGTKLNDKLKKKSIIKDSNFCGNNKYDIEDDMVRKVYYSLKKWHKSHSKIYDMTIDPLTAPKAISEYEMYEFYTNILKLKDLDLKMFKQILYMVKTYDNLDIDRYTDHMISQTEKDYKDITEDVEKVYVKSKLKYKADTNPFI
ncbi:MAG: hypothetical protein IJF92_03835 [Bacilli bacterium]|nr:hypothetical protein [Bacilli bacterium]